MDTVHMQRKGTWPGSARRRATAILGIALMGALLATTPGQASPAARAGGSVPTPDPHFYWDWKTCFKASQGTPFFCAFPHNGTGAPLRITASSLNHGNAWVNQHDVEVNDAILINDYDYDTTPSGGTSIPNGKRAAFVARADFPINVVGSMSLGNASVNMRIHFKVSPFSTHPHDWGCDITSPNPPKGWYCATSIWGQGFQRLAVATNTYCCVSDQLTASTSPTVTTAATRTAAPVITLPVQCKASRRSSCRGMLSFRAGQATRTTRFIVPRGTQRQVVLRLRKPLTQRGTSSYHLRLATIQPNGRAVRTHEQRGRPRDLLAPAQ
jgi:hypothetical protein